MSLREQMIIKDGRARPPALMRKVCLHNGADDLQVRARGDMGYDIDFILGRQEEIYTCIQCGWTISEALMMDKYKAYMLTGAPIMTGRMHEKRNHDNS